jgi:Flp pilus assembly protein TadG
MLTNSPRFRLRRLARSESGAELIEFSLTLPLLLLLVLGIIEFGFIFREYEVVTNAAREGARIAILPSYEDEDVTARVEDYLEEAGLDLDSATVTPGAATPTPIGGVCVSLVPVTVAYEHPLPFVGGIMSYFDSDLGTVTLTATSSMRTETAAGACAAP